MNRDFTEYLQVLGFEKSEVAQSSSLVSALPQGNAQWGETEKEAQECKACPSLAGNRTQMVFGAGTHPASLMFVGEAPGEFEDRQNIPFAGEAGQLLNRMVQAMGLSFDGIYSTTLVKCRPPQNRNPLEAEISSCHNFLKLQIAHVNPVVIVTLGALACQEFFSGIGNFDEVRGRIYPSPHFQRADKTPVKVLATYHPAHLLRDPSLKKAAWMDLQIVMQVLGLKGAK